MEGILDEGHDDATHPPTHGRSRLPRRRSVRLGVIGCVLLGVALVAAACSSAPPGLGVAGAADGATTTAASTNNQPPKDSAANAAAMLSYSQCMQSHGVSRTSPTRTPRDRSSCKGARAAISTPTTRPSRRPTRHASRRCRLRPRANRRRRCATPSGVSQCMRDHGIKDFPDPSSSGGRISMSINGSAGSDLNPNDPLFQAAQKACMPNAPTLRSGGAGRAPIRDPIAPGRASGSGDNPHVLRTHGRSRPDDDPSLRRVE